MALSVNTNPPNLNISFVIPEVVVSAANFSRTVRDSTFYKCPNCGGDSIVHEKNMPSGKDYYSGYCPLCDVPITWNI